MENTKAASPFKIVFAAIIGHALEFYDFTIYAVFAVKIGQLFFPSDSEVAQILASLGVFAVGFFMRPLGGVLFGHIGDTHGRKTALVISVVGMAIFTFIIGLMPDYHTIGIAAPIILVLCRLAQGLCVGGEGAGASIFVLEHLRDMRPGFIGGIVNAALTLGILLAILTGMILNHYFAGDENTWRYAFIIGGFAGLFGLYIRMSIDETPVFEEIQENHQTLELPIREVFRTNMRGVILCALAGALTGASAYYVMTFINIFLTSIMEMPAATALYYSAFGNILLIFMLPLMGIFSDRAGYTRTMSMGCIMIFLFATTAIKMLASADPISMHVAIFMMALIAATVYAPLYPFMLKLFTPEQRYSGIACSLNIGIALFGGTCTMISIWLVSYTGLKYSPAFYWNFVSAMFLTGVLFLKRDEVRSFFSLYKTSDSTTDRIADSIADSPKPGS